MDGGYPGAVLGGHAHLVRIRVRVRDWARGRDWVRARDWAWV